MRKVIEEVIFSNESSYEIYTRTGVNQGIINDIKDGYRSCLLYTSPSPRD